MHDGALIQVVDAAMAEAVRKAGPWLACRPGCAECCIGPFAITALDAQRLREGLSAIDPTVAARVLDRARNYVEDDSAPCPALDPETKTCDLYDWRPVTCRTFGPAVRFGGESVAVCELCFDGATPDEVEACAVELPVEAFAEDEFTVAQTLCP